MAEVAATGAAAASGVDPTRRPVRPGDPGTRHEPTHGVAAEGHDDRRIQDLELAAEERRTRRDLLGLRIAVAGRAALDDVGDEHVAPCPADVAEQVHEQPAGTADERTTLPILVLARALADEDHL